MNVQNCKTHCKKERNNATIAHFVRLEGKCKNYMLKKNNKKKHDLKKIIRERPSFEVLQLLKHLFILVTKMN